MRYFTSNIDIEQKNKSIITYRFFS